MCVSSSYGRGLVGLVLLCAQFEVPGRIYRRPREWCPAGKKVMGLPRDEEEEERGEERRMRNLGKPELPTEGQKTKRRGRTFRRIYEGTKRRK